MGGGTASSHARASVGHGMLRSKFCSIEAEAEIELEPEPDSVWSVTTATLCSHCACFPASASASGLLEAEALAGRGGGSKCAAIRRMTCSVTPANACEGAEEAVGADAADRLRRSVCRAKDCSKLHGKYNTRYPAPSVSTKQRKHQRMSCIRYRTTKRAGPSQTHTCARADTPCSASTDKTCCRPPQSAAAAVKQQKR
jgi:hypothetical protein